jgi:hypothetical protein
MQNEKNRIMGIVKECVFRGDYFKVTLNCHGLLFVFSLTERCEIGKSIAIQMTDSSIVCLEE